MTVDCLITNFIVLHAKMNPNWKFKIALCLIVLYVIQINCDDTDKGTKKDDKGDEKEPKGDDKKPKSDEKEDQKFPFKTSKTIEWYGNKTYRQIQCSPDALCNKVGLNVSADLNFECTGNITLNQTYSCGAGDTFKPTEKKVNATYMIVCPKDEKDKSPANVEKVCWLNVTLTKISSDPGYGGPSAWVIVGIIILIIAVLIATVALLGYRNIGPMASFFNE